MVCVVPVVLTGWIMASYVGYFTLQSAARVVIAHLVIITGFTYVAVTVGVYVGEWQGYLPATILTAVVLIFCLAAAGFTGGVLADSDFYAMESAE